MTEPAASKPQDSEKGKWMALLAALLGWLFDGFEIGLFPLTGKPALKELLTKAAEATQAAGGAAFQAADIAKAVDAWFGVIIAVFLVGAATGGVLFGWLGDRVGRVRAMSASIIFYALFTGACGFATEAWQIAGLRFLASLGMGGEWSLGVALVNEIWPGKSRAFIAGLIGAAANVGFLLVALLSMGMLSLLQELNSGMQAIGLSKEFVERLLSNNGWRFLMISGTLPAVLTFFIRICVPESHKWEEEKAKGSTSMWSNIDLFGVLGGCLGAVLVIAVWTPYVQSLPIRLIGSAVGLVIALFGFLHPVKQYLIRANVAGTFDAERTAVVKRRLLFGAGLAGVALLGTWGSIQWAPNWTADLAKAKAEQITGTKDADPTKVEGTKFAREWAQFWQSIGAIIGTIGAAVAADRFGRRATYCGICIASLLSCVALYQLNVEYSNKLLFSVTIAGGATAAMYGFFPLYFPELFPTSIRATGQGFCFNFGRVLAAVGGLQTANLKAYFGSFPQAGTVLSAIYLIGAVLIWFGPETKGKPLPE